MDVVLKEDDYMYRKLSGTFNADFNSCASASVPTRVTTNCVMNPDVACLKQALCENKSLHDQLMEGSAGDRRLVDMFSTGQMNSLKLTSNIFCSIGLIGIIVFGLKG